MATILPDPSVTNRRNRQQAFLLSIRLRQAALVLLVLYGTSLVISVLPFQVFTPTWYLNATNVVIANAPIVITAACLHCIGLGVCPVEMMGGSARKTWFRRICVFLSIIHFTLVPLQILSSVFFLIQFNASQQSRLEQLQSEQRLASQRLLSITSIAELNARIAPPSGQSRATLEQRRADIREALANEQRQFRSNLGQQRQQRQLQLLLNSVRIVITALASALFFRMLALPSDQLLSQAMRNLKHRKHTT
jgi:hypothetical protein